MVEQMKTKMEPRVRFRGFTDEWEQVKLGDVSNKVTTKNKNNTYNETFTNSAEHGIVTQRDFFDKDISNKSNLKGYYVVSPDDFIYNPRISNFAPVGPIKRNKLGRTGVMSPLYNIFSTHDIDNLYLEKYFETTFWHRFMKSHGDSGARADRFNISYSVFENMPIPYPGLSEQQKIGELFQTLDNVIDLSNTQVESLKQQKKALLQLLFPQKGETEPKVHLRGFMDAWNEVKLGDVFSVYSEKGRTDLPFVTVGERETNERTASAQGYGNDVSDKARAKAKVLLSGQFLIDLSSYSRGIYMSRMDGVTSSAYNVLNLDNGAGSYWVEYLISHDFVESLKRLTPPGARQGKMIEVDGLLKTKIFMPSLEEQQAIGELFQTLDEQIRLAEDKVSQYKELKQALLQRLFV